jgi:hypothetical protein
MHFRQAIVASRFIYRKRRVVLAEMREEQRSLTDASFCGMNNSTGLSFECDRAQRR